MSSVYYTTEGIILKKTPQREYDFLVRILTHDFGKIDLRARGARKSNAKLNAHLDFLDEISISFVKNGDNIPTIIDSKKISSNTHWFKSQNSLREAAHIARVIDLIIPLEVKDVKLFSLVRHFFVSGNQNSAEYFVRSIILHEGYGKALSLPIHAQDFIIKEWPVLKS